MSDVKVEGAPDDLAQCIEQAARRWTFGRWQSEQRFTAAIVFTG